MAQDITIAGATFSDVPSIEVPKATSGTAVFTDTSDATATAADIASGKTAYADGVKLTGTGSTGGDGMYYGVCGTAAATAAKVVTISGITALTAGLSIRVKFTYAQTASAPTLNVNSLGAKSIKRYGTTNAAAYEWVAGEVIDFVYDGTYWLMVDGGLATTTYYGVTKLSSSTSSTSTVLAATPSAVKAAYDLAAGKQDALSFDSAPTSGSANPVTSGGVYTALSGKAPTSHASTAATYGIGTASSYGHVKLSDSTTTISGASAGVAATPTAVKAAKDAADDAYDLADTKATITQLWENSSPGSSFTAQTVSIPGLSDYDLVVIEVAFRTTDQGKRTSAIVGFEEGAIADPCIAGWISGTGTRLAFRSCTLAADGITFTTGNYCTFGSSATTESAAYAVPVRVVGIKL